MTSYIYFDSALYWTVGGKINSWVNGGHRKLFLGSFMQQKMFRYLKKPCIIVKAHFYTILPNNNNNITYLQHYSHQEENKQGKQFQKLQKQVFPTIVNQ